MPINNERSLRLAAVNRDNCPANSGEIGILIPLQGNGNILFRNGVEGPGGKARSLPIFSICQGVPVLATLEKHLKDLHKADAELYTNIEVASGRTPKSLKIFVGWNTTHQIRQSDKRSSVPFYDVFTALNSGRISDLYTQIALGHFFNNFGHLPKFHLIDKSSAFLHGVAMPMADKASNPYRHRDPINANEWDEGKAIANEYLLN